MYEFEVAINTMVLPEEIWKVWSNPRNFPDWDSRELETRMDGEFSEGTKIFSKQKFVPAGWATITEIKPNENWQVTSDLPGGKLVIDHFIQVDEERGDATIYRIGKRYTVDGPFQYLFKIIWGPILHHQLPDSLFSLVLQASKENETKE